MKVLNVMAQDQLIIFFINSLLNGQLTKIFLISRKGHYLIFI